MTACSACPPAASLHSPAAKDDAGRRCTRTADGRICAGGTPLRWPRWRRGRSRRRERELDSGATPHQRPHAPSARRLRNRAAAETPYRPPRLGLASHRLLGERLAVLACHLAGALCHRSMDILKRRNEMYIKAPKPNEQKFYDFLEELRQSGDTNMFGGAQYLQQEFGIRRLPGGCSNEIK